MASRRFTALDFDQSKANIITELSANPQLQDYDFTGSNLNILVDALAYATATIGVYANMSASEIFMESAQIRNSVVSHAKSKSYIPRQINSAVATINITVPAPVGNTDSTLTINRGTKLTSQLNNKTYNYVFVDDARMGRVGDNFVLNGTEIRQGSLHTQEWEYTATARERYIIEQLDVDSNFLRLTVKESKNSNQIDNWELYDEITRIDEATPAFFIQEADDQHVEVYFGDGVVGKALEVGNLIQAEYLTTKGADGNHCNQFELISDIRGISRSNFTVTTAEKSNSGAAAESIDSIKHNAPNSFAAQKRAVTTNDYETLLDSKYGAIQTMNVWGGEENDPPQYGKVFASIKPTFGTELSPATKRRIENDILRKYQMVGIRPIIVDAEFTYVNMATVLDVDLSKTTLIEGQLIDDVSNKIGDYFTNVLNKFNTSFKYSNISSVIDQVSPAVLSSESKITMSKKFVPNQVQAQTYIFSFHNPIEPNTLYSTYNDGSANVSEIKDDGLGQVYSYYNTVRTGNIGTIDYVTGKVALRPFRFVITGNTKVVFNATPVSSNVESVRNNMVISGIIDVTIPLVIVTQ